MTSKSELLEEEVDYKPPDENTWEDNQHDIIDVEAVQKSLSEGWFCEALHMNKFPTNCHQDSLILSMCMSSPTRILMTCHMFLRKP